ncbi:hypothetical protein A7K91_15620 [Paenibacillus oryzae]|uniref:DUF3951 domain-containing protein n=1 Tax=Paenibacillus oryzae TaxID=1844972 RepID=A0A1A5YB63_9BACL|nr:DUF3951 domain-containing protein [Paenibacillus oryzae]OBR62817.1 hypothetical protein A7K91_15620 [Paenibacillus oryzae]
MNYVVYIAGGVSATFFIALAIIIVKVFVTRKLPSNHYTPFDYITAHSQVEFHEEKQEKEEDDDHGDDKNKNTPTVEEYIRG